MMSVHSSLQKYDRYPPEVDQFCMDNAWKAAEYLISDQLRGVNLRKFSLDEAKEILDGKKACGWPYCAKYATKAQAWADPNFMNDFKIFDDRLHSDRGISNLDTIFLKHELRPIEKCGAGKARTVFCQDVVSAVWGTMYNKHFDMTIIDNFSEAIYNNAAIVVGMSPYNNTFQLLADKFTGYTCFEMDGSAWDTTMYDDVHQNIANIRINAYAYDELDAKALRNYYKQVNHTSVVLPDGSIKYRRSGNPSGQSSTTIDNSIWTLVVNIYLLIKYFKKRKIVVTQQWLDMYIKWIVFGDDIIWGIKNGLVSELKLDCQSMIDEMLIIANDELGIRFTSSPPSPIVGLKWLNKGWGIKNGQWVPTVDIVKMLNSLYVQSKNRSARDVLERALTMRMDSYGTPQMYAYLNQFIDWMVEKYGIFDLKPMWLTEFELQSLYNGSDLIHVVVGPDWAGFATPVLHKNESVKGL